MNRWLPMVVLTLSFCGCRGADTGSAPTPVLAGNGAKTAEHAPAPPHAAPGSVSSATDISSEDSKRYADVTQLQQVDRRSGKPEAERLQGILAILRRELEGPAFPTMGLAGGPTDSGYVVEQATYLLGLQISPTVLRTAYQQERDDQMRQLLSVALAIAHDQSCTAEVRRVARENPMGAVRALAVRALARQRDQANREVLMSALLDPYTSVVFGFEVSEPYKLYRVRYEAVEGLRLLGESPPTPTTVRVPFSHPKSNAELYSHLLEDGDPQSCLAGVQLLAGEGAKGRPLLTAFLQKYAQEPALKQSVELARKSLR